MTIVITKPELFAAACRFTSTEQARQYLQSVAIQPHPVQGAWIVATDGHRLFCGHDAEAEFLNGPAHNCLFQIEKRKMPVAAFKSQRLILDGVSASFCGWYESDGQKVTPLATDFIMTAPSMGHEWTFPTWQNVLPDANADLVPACDHSFDGAYIAEFNEIERRLTGQKNVAFKARLTGGNPALVSLGRDDCFAVLMPMRCHNGEEEFNAPRAMVADAKIAGGFEAMAAE